MKPNYEILKRTTDQTFVGFHWL